MIENVLEVKAEVLNFNQEPPLVLVADDDPVIRLQLRHVLESEQYQVVEVSDGMQCLDLYIQSKPDLVLLDALMPVMDGFTCCAALRSLHKECLAPVLMITALEDPESVDRAFEVGATDFVTKPINWAVLRQRLRRLTEQVQLQKQQALLYQRLEETNQVLKRLAWIDDLTQVANRRWFDDYLNREWQRMRRENQSLSLILCDIDYFKAYNDTYGHPAGDRCLREVAQAIQSAGMRSADLTARYGGEEFAVILPNTSAAGAKKVATKICARVKALQVAHANSGVCNYITLSLGVASTIPLSETDASMLIDQADKALYRAKKNGRNRVVVVGETHSLVEF